MIFFLLLVLDILQLFYSLHYTSFPFLKGCRLEKGHIVPVLCSHSQKEKKNKEGLFTLLSDALYRLVVPMCKHLVVTDDMGVLSKSLLPNQALIIHCTHEKPNHMLLYVAQVAKKWEPVIMTQTIDTDVAMLAMAVAQSLQSENEFWLAFGTGKNF